MAKRNADGSFEPGIIYELRCSINGQWHPFYVGETTNARQRLAQHRTAGANADDDSTLVYSFINEVLDANNIAWDLFEVECYGAEGPTDREDEHIMRLILDDVALKNMKKGNAQWMEQRLAEAADMRQRGIVSYRKYREVLTLEEKERQADERRKRWIAETQGGDQSGRSPLLKKWQCEEVIIKQQQSTEQTLALLKARKKEARQEQKDIELISIRAQQEEIWRTTGKTIDQQNPKDWK